MTSSLQTQSDDSGADEHQQESRSEMQHESPVAGIAATAPVGHIVPLNLEVGNSMAPMAYPFIDPYFGGMLAASTGQTMIYPHLMAMHHHPGLPLPSNVLEEPLYVNAKQYHGILRRRQSRAKAESENKLMKSRKPYLHESRHLHALKRARGCGGRFVDAKSEGNKRNDNASDETVDGCNKLTPQKSCVGNLQDAVSHGKSQSTKDHE